MTQEDIRSELNKLMKALNQKILSVKNELNEELAVYRSIRGPIGAWNSNLHLKRKL